MTHLIKTLINASEKAANIARSCVGTNEVSDALLVAQKCDGEANTRFNKDFKTIADVLAQETAKANITKDFPVLADHVRGEECSEIGGKVIKLMETEAETEELLQSLVKSELAMQMAKAAHNDIQNDISCFVPDSLPDLDANDLGVWIDPIDATAEFIAGVQGKAKSGEGLECVTVLIGAYLRSTGEPVIGVINQPFYKNGKGRVIWGISYDGINKRGVTDNDVLSPNNVILMSNAEDSNIKQKINTIYNINTAPGAGNKLMKVSLGEAMAYVLSKGTTFLWDTCAPHAILKATGGDIISYKSHESIKYNVPDNKQNQQYCNSDGIVAYNGDIALNEFLTILQ